MVNINIKIPDALHKKIKLNAVMEETTLKEFIINKLEKEIRK